MDVGSFRVGCFFGAFVCRWAWFWGELLLFVGQGIQCAAPGEVSRFYPKAFVVCTPAFRRIIPGGNEARIILGCGAVFGECSGGVGRVSCET